MKRRYSTFLSLSIVLTLLLAACGGSKDEESSATTQAEAPTTTAQDVSAACADDLAIEQGFDKVFSDLEFPEEGKPPSTEFKAKLKQGYDQYLAKPFESVLTHPPAEVKVDLEKAIGMFRDGVATGDLSAFDKPEFEAVGDHIDTFFYENCEGTKTAVTAVDYGYQGLPTQLKAGVNRFKLTNSGTEHHEMAILTRKAGVTDSFDKILSLPEEQGKAKADSVTSADSNPGKSGYTAVDLKPGSYIVVCFVPKGSTGDKPGDGPPHFTLGMKQEITVS
jgi:uncharacterized cupredoxin-like copper-binding protein